MGIRFTGYGLDGTSHPLLYPPGLRFLFSHLPLLSARVDLASLRAASSTERAALYAAGTVGTVLVRPRDPGLRGMARRLGRARDARRLRRRDERVRGAERGFTIRRGPEPGVAGPAGALGLGTAQTRRVYDLFCGGRATKLAYAPRGWSMAPANALSTFGTPGTFGADSSAAGTGGKSGVCEIKAGVHTGSPAPRRIPP